MRFSLGLLTLATLAAGLSAQTNNEFGVYNGQTTFTSRSGVGGGTHGDILVRITGDTTTTNVSGLFSGVGQGAQSSTNGTVGGFRLVLQDQNAGTQEDYRFVVVGEDSANLGQPDPSVAGILLQSASVQSPSGTGTLAWVITSTFTTPQSTQVPESGTFFMGYTLSPNATWTADGLSIHGAAYVTPMGFPDQGENPRTGAPNFIYAVNRPGFGQAGTVQTQVAARAHRMYMMTPNDVLNVGADIPASRQKSTATNPDYGVAGLYPDVAMGDGVTWRYRTANAGSGLLLLSSDRGNSPGVGFPFLTGKLYLNFITLTVLQSGITLQAAPTDNNIAPAFTAAGQINSLSGGGILTWQGVNLAGSTLSASNSTATDF